MPPRFERILAARLDNIGDVVMVGPALRAVKAALPDAHLTLWTSPAGATVAPLLPGVDDVLVSRVVWQDARHQLPLDPQRELALVDELRRRNFDAALLFTSFSQSPWPPAYVCYLAGIPVRAGESKEFGGSLLTHPVPSIPDGVHAAERNLHLVESLGFPVADRHLALKPPPPIELPRPYVVVAPGASCEARRYAPERFTQVAAGLAVQGHRVIVVGSEKERDLVPPLPGVTNLAGRTSIPELAAVIANAELVVANDSGPMHLADAYNRPSVILYSGAELESQYAPRRAPTRLLRRDTDCYPCHRFECPYGMPCLDITPEEVLAACAS